MEGKAVVGKYTIYGDCVIQQQFIDRPFHCMLWSFLCPSNNMASGNIFSRHRHTAICGAGRIFWLALSVQSLMWVGMGEKVVWWENVAHADMPSRDWELIIWASRAGEKDTEKKKTRDFNLKDTLLLHEMSWQENQAKIFLPSTFWIISCGGFNGEIYERDWSQIDRHLKWVGSTKRNTSDGGL